ncbi:MAG: hypothetical protein JO168_07265, partial [Solirubrobacterales bacterium]|nr:hypothetical protein [Solirubrobacterales bacterium]
MSLQGAQCKRVPAAASYARPMSRALTHESTIRELAQLIVRFGANVRP